MIPHIRISSNGDTLISGGDVVVILNEQVVKALTALHEKWSPGLVARDDVEGGELLAVQITWREAERRQG